MGKLSQINKESTVWDVYMHTNSVTGKSYIGITKYGMMKRWYQHITEALRYNSVFAFHNSIRVHGKDVWEHKVLHSNIPTLQEAETLEIAMINEFNTYTNGYNSTKGGKLPYDKIKKNFQIHGHVKRRKYVKNVEKFWFYHKEFGTDFCSRSQMIQKYSLHKSSLNKVVAGDRSHHRGWIVIHATPNKGTIND